MQPSDNDRIDVATAKQHIDRILATATDAQSARAATVELTQVLPQLLDSKIDPAHNNVMLYSGGMSGDYPNYHKLGGLESANDLAKVFAQRYVQKDAHGKDTDGVSIIDNTDRAKFLSTPEFNKGVEKLVKMYMGPDGDNERKLRAELTEVKLNNEKAPWKVASSDFVESAPGRNFFTVIPEGDFTRVFGQTELPTFVDTHTATHLNNVPMDELAAKHARDGNEATFNMLKEDSRETLNYMFTKAEVNLESGKVELKPVITTEALEHMGYSAIPNANVRSGQDAAMEGAFQGMRGETGPKRLPEVAAINNLTDKLQAAGPIRNEPGMGMLPDDFVAQRREQLAAVGGKSRDAKPVIAPAGGVQKEFGPPTAEAAAKQQAQAQKERPGMMPTGRGWEMPKDLINTLNGNAQPLKPFNGTVEKVDAQHGTVTVKVDAAQSRLNKVDFKLADHPELGSALKGDKVQCDVKNGKLEPVLTKALPGIAGNALDNAKHLNAPGHGGPGPAGAAVDAAAHASVNLGQHRAVGGGRGGR